MRGSVGRFLPLLVLLGALPVGAEEHDGFPRFDFHLLGDLRGVYFDETETWFSRGLGKARYGSEDGEAGAALRVGQAAVVLSAYASDELFGRIQINVDSDPDPLFVDDALDRLHLTEAVVSYRPVVSPHVRLTARAGLMFPFTVEHTSLGWSPTYTITPNPANTWMGEEVRPWALELGLSTTSLNHELTVAAATFWGSDPTGTLLAWRGWALHDRNTGLDDRIPLPRIPSLEEGGFFARNAPWVEPTREMDGQPGWWVTAGWNRLRVIEIEGFYFDNRADPTIFDGTQYGWRTRFYNGTVIVQLPGPAELFLQHLGGDTVMGPRVVVNDFATSSAMVTLPFAGRHRLTARYDWFEVEDLDPYPDPNDEEGDAWTLAYLVETGRHHRLALEVMRIYTDRQVRSELGLPVDQEEMSAQLSFRVWY